MIGYSLELSSIDLILIDSFLSTVYMFLFDLYSPDFINNPTYEKQGPD